MQLQLEAILKKYNLETETIKFAAFLQLLQKWNKAFNLTAIRDLEDMISLHIDDSLAILPYINGSYLLDVGSGGGFPGIPIALALPNAEITLIDSNGKKIHFLNEVKRVLAVKNINVIQTRVENYKSEQKFDTIMSRAFSNISQMLDWTKHLIAKNGIWLALKGPNPETELVDLPYQYEVKHYSLQNSAVNHSCVIIKQS